MRVRINKTRFATTAVVLLLAGLLTGCKDDTGGTGQKPTPPPVVSNKPVERVELMPDDSDEFLRRHIFNADGIEVETRIDYRNGDRAVIKFRRDQTRESLKRTASTGTVILEQNFAADGKLVLSGHELRSDGSLKWEAVQDSTGVVKTVTYWYDGKSVFSRKTEDPQTNAWNATYWRKDGTLWAKRNASGNVIDQEEQYDESGKLAALLERNGQEIVVSLLRGDGTVHYRQHITETPYSYGNYGYTYKKTSYVEEYGADGKTLVRKLVMDRSGSYAETVERQNDDGTTTVRTLKYDSTVTREEKRDRSGQTISQRNVAPSEGVYEQYEASAVRANNFDDPVYNWDRQEKYPYTRR